MYDCPDRIGLDGIQSVTYVCHRLDSHPGQSRIGCPIRDWDWMILKSVQSLSRIGHFLKSSKPSHGLDVQSVT